MDNITAKKHLDTVIRKARVHFYKPIQIAEILRRDRIDGDISLSDLETYRTPSRKWRDGISLQFIGRISTSSAKYQDNLFEANATPPVVLAHLGKINRSNNGAVEAYIYAALRERLSQMASGLSLVLQADRAAFALRSFIESFTRSPGLSRSVDKIFEIVVYALFSTLLEALEVKIGVRIDNIENTILREFSDFTEKSLGYPKTCRRGIKTQGFIGLASPTRLTEDLICGELWCRYSDKTHILDTFNGGTHSQRNFRRQNNHYLQGM